MIQPKFGVITNIGREHLEFFGDVAGVAREEGLAGGTVAGGRKTFCERRQRMDGKNCAADEGESGSRRLREKKRLARGKNPAGQKRRDVSGAGARKKNFAASIGSICWAGIRW
jgi:UDP-N-acetylmuramate-alanine ligase